MEDFLKSYSWQVFQLFIKPRTFVWRCFFLFRSSSKFLLPSLSVSPSSCSRGRDLGIVSVTSYFIGCFGRLWIQLMKWVDVFPQSFIWPSAFDWPHCHLQSANDGCYLDESWIFSLSSLDWIIFIISPLKMIAKIKLCGKLLFTFLFDIHKIGFIPVSLLQVMLATNSLGISLLFKNFTLFFWRYLLKYFLLLNSKLHMHLKFQILHTY